MKKDSILFAIYYGLSVIVFVLVFDGYLWSSNIRGIHGETTEIILGSITLFLGLFISTYSYKAIILKLVPLLLITVIILISLYSPICATEGKCDGHAVALMGLIPLTIGYALVHSIITLIIRKRSGLQKTA